MKYKGKIILTVSGGKQNQHEPQTVRDSPVHKEQGINITDK